MSSFHLMRKGTNPCRRCGNTPVWNETHEQYECPFCDDSKVRELRQKLIRKEAARNVWNDANPKKDEK